MYLAGWVHLLLSGSTVRGLSAVNTGAVRGTLGPALDQLAPTPLQFEILQLVQLVQLVQILQLVQNTLFYKIQHTDLRAILEDNHLNRLIGGSLVELRLRLGLLLVPPTLANRGSRS